MNSILSEKRAIALSVLLGHKPKDKFEFHGHRLTCADAAHSVMRDTPRGRALVEELTQGIFREQEHFLHD